MGFYGNITNTSKTQFQFDKIYPNRITMTNECLSDGVYPGRYVLIEYGSSENPYKSIYLYNGKAYAGLEGFMYDDIETKQTIQIYTQPAAGLEYKIVSSDYVAKNEADLFLKADEIVSTMSKQRIFNLNTETRYINSLNIEASEYSSSDLERYTANQQEIEEFLKQKYNKPDDTNWYQKEEWSIAADAYIVNGKVITPEKAKLQAEGYPIENIVWRIKPYCEYYVNEYNQYFKVDVSKASLVNGVYQNATFKIISGTGSDSDYVNNFNLDRDAFKTNRGYDSTVWQKTFVNGEEKYVMVAELNSVVPTFDIVNDAPTLLPLTPHFDGNSTNVYYRLHWQPSWAIRTKAASPLLKGQRISQKGIFETGASVDLTDDSVHYPSDQNTIWSGQFYNTLTNSTVEKTYSPYTSQWEDVQSPDDLEACAIPAAVYYNKSGFNAENISYSNFITTVFDDEDAQNPYYNSAITASAWSADEDKIGFFPTGRSGHMYNNHDDSLEGEAQIDTQEFICMLPSIGNTIASVWDMVYGGRNTNKTIEKTLKRNLKMGWQDGADLPDRTGLRLRNYELGYAPLEANTIVGAINSVHDLMGMIITKKSGTKQEIENNISELSLDRIYFLPDAGQDYYRKQLQYKYDAIKPEDFATAKTTAFSQVTDLKDFNKEVLCNYDKDGNFTSYNKVFYQEPTNRSMNGDPSKYNYLQETVYHPNRLYFQLDEGEIEKYEADKRLTTYAAGAYFYTTDDMKNTLLIDEAEEASDVKQYFELEDYGLYGNLSHFTNYYVNSIADSSLHKMIPLPVPYDNSKGDIYSVSDLGEIIPNRGNYNLIHGIYKPNTYYYAETQKIGDETVVTYKMDSSPIMTKSVYYTIDASEKLEADDNSYRLIITYKIIDGVTEENYKPNQYFYVAKNNTITKEQLEAGDVPTGTVISAIDDFNAVKGMAKSFPLREGVEGFLLKEVKTYIQNNEPSYRIEQRPIFLFDFEERSIFIPRFDEDTQQLKGMNFITEDSIPTTTWIRDEENGTLKLALMDDEGNYYEDNNVLYALGVQAGTQNAIDYNLINLDELAADTKDRLKHPLKKCVGTFYESGFYHYTYDNGDEIKDPLENSYLLDTSLEGQYEDYGFITYYKINPEDISLINGTFTVQEAGKYATGTDVRGLFYKTGSQYKPAYNIPIDTQLYRAIPSTKFYEPNKYYVKDGEDHYTLSYSSDKPDKVLYTKAGLYVMEDKNGVYPPGTEWNLDCDKYDSANITLGKRSEKYGLVQIPNLARTDNTIHGLILRINQVLETGNTGTRDINTVQGALNRLNDLIARIDKMKSGDFVLVDEYGRLHSAGFNSYQAFNAYNHGTNKSTSKPEVTDKTWLSIDVTPTYSNPSFTITHTFHEVASTETMSDKNGDALPANKTAGINNSKGDSIQLYTPIVDDMGHVVGKNTEEVVLPYSFKTITAANSDAVTTGASTITANNVIADNTQDTLALSASNKWIKLDTSVADSIKFGHYAGGFTKGAANTEYGLSASKTVADLDSGNSFIVPNFKFDEAGHITSAENQTISLPENFTKVATTVSTSTSNSAAGSAGTIEADTLTDTLTLAEGNKWINIAADATNDKITFSHYVSAFNESTGTAVNFNTSGNSFTVVSDTAHDEAGHLTGVTNTTFTLPNSLKTINIGAASSANTFASASNTAITAGSPRASMSINPGNKWITLTSDGSTMTINHAAAGSVKTNGTVIPENQTPAFGGTFNIPTIGIDEAGHIANLGTKTVSLPELPALSSTVLGGDIDIRNFANWHYTDEITFEQTEFANDTTPLIDIINTLIFRVNMLEMIIANQLGGAPEEGEI